MSENDFETIQKFVLPFGKHKGQELGVVGQSNDGLAYLDWCLRKGKIWDSTKEVIRKYMEHPTIAARVGPAREESERKFKERKARRGPPREDIPF